MDGDPRLVQSEQHRFGLHAPHRQAEEVGHPLDGIAQHGHLVHRAGRLDHVLRPPATGPRISSSSRPGVARASAAAPKPMAATTFSMPARRARSWSPPTRTARAQPAADDQGPDAGRSAQLVGGHRHQIGAEPVEIDGQVPGGHDRVDMDRQAGGAAVLDHGRHRLDGADLVVGPLAVDQGRGPAVVDLRAGDGIGHRFDRDPTGGVHRRR